MAGNANSGKKLDKSWSEALRLELYQNDRKGLRELARLTIARAMSGDMTAVREIADRLEGKPLQQTENHNLNENVFAFVTEVSSQEEWRDMIAEIRDGDTKIVASGNGKHNGNGAKKATSGRTNGH